MKNSLESRGKGEPLHAFLAPFCWGAQKREIAAPKASGCFVGGTRDLGRNRECRSRETAGRGNSPEAILYHANTGRVYLW